MAIVTPGPWRFQTDPTTGDCGIYAEGTGIFAEAFADIRHAGEGNRTEALANARLIAAAPDLLEALKAAKEVVDVAEKMTSSRSDDEFVWAAQEKIIAAIAKAEGRS